MPNAPTPIFAIPGPDLADGPADIEAALDPIRNRLEEILVGLSQVPIGAQLPYAGSVAPDELGDVEFALCQGQLIDRTVYATFFSRVGHAYNGGIDPGSNQVRLPNKQGRISIGVGTAAGARGAVAKTLGVRGGEETNQLQQSQMPYHVHGTVAHQHGLPWTPLTTNGGTHWAYGTSQVIAEIQLGANVTNFGGGENTGAAGGSGGVAADHNNLPPYEVDSWIVRIK